MNPALASFRFDSGLCLVLPVPDEHVEAVAKLKLERGVYAMTLERPGQPVLYRARRGRPPKRFHQARAGTTATIGPRHAPTTSLVLHPSAAVVPEASPNEYQALLEDIRRDGVQEPLRVLGNTVLDGRHRLRAALEAGLASVPVVDAVLSRGETAEAYLLRTALHRRNLSDDQRAIMAARAAGVMQVSTGRRRDRAAVEFSVTAHKVRDALELLRLAPAEAEQVLAGREKLSKALTATKRQRQLAQVAATPPPTGTYRAIVVDPPWEYDDESIPGAAAHQYATMSYEQLKALNVAALAAEDGCHLFLWATSPMLPLALALIEAWGFTYKQTLTWTKDRLGMGRYFRIRDEFLLFATRGRTLPLKSQSLSSGINAPATRHSAKPDAMYAHLEEGTFEPRLEMFARKAREGWTTWGAEAPRGESDGPPTPAIHETGEDIKPIDGEDE
jgi:N6-adenosine-specific RNA methylase IME4/ParB-like chromosome segregation protein Spo0J